MGRPLVILAGGSNIQVMDRHRKLGLGGDSSTDIFLGWKDIDGVYLEDGGTYS